MSSRVAFLFLAIVSAAMISLAVPVARAADMRFQLVPVGDIARCGGRCPMAIAAQGEITNSTPEEFTAFVAANLSSDMLSVVYLDSPGGKVVSSMALGKVFRKLGVAAIVARPIQGTGTSLEAGRCFSACVYALIGAKQRVIPPQSQVGIHRMFSYDSSNDPAGGTIRTMHHDDGGMRELIANYSSTMGVSRGLIDAAEQTSSGTIRILSPSEITRWRLGRMQASLGSGHKGQRRRN